MEHYSTVILQTILTKFFPYRQIKHTPQDILKDQQTISAELTIRGYIPIIGESKGRGDRKNVVAILISETGDYIKGSSQIKNLIQQIINSYNKKNDLDEIILIITNEMFSKKTIIDTLMDDVKLASVKHDPDGKSFYITVASYENFVVDIPSMTHLHRIATDKELKELEGFYTNPTTLPLINRTDPPIIWLGGRVGQYVVIERSSQTSIMTIDIRKIK